MKLITNVSSLSKHFISLTGDLCLVNSRFLSMNIVINIKYKISYICNNKYFNTQILFSLSKKNNDEMEVRSFVLVAKVYEILMIISGYQNFT